MRNSIKTFLSLGFAGLMAAGCSGFLEPLANGSYNEDNYRDYPTLVRGFIIKAYNLRPPTYYRTEYIGADAASDNAVYRSQTSEMRQFSVGNTAITSNPFAVVWSRSYEGINYCNMFLKDRIGINTHYLLDSESDMVLRRNLQGDAYALRAWYYYDLLRTFGGVGTDGNLLGVPIMTEPTDAEHLNTSAIKRSGFDETIAQILEDCDSAEVYLPLNNRDYPGDKVYSTPIMGSARYRCFDQVSLNGLRAMTYLLWASPAFNREGDNSRYQKAAEYAAKVMKHKLNVESTVAGGFNPSTSFSWLDLNCPEVINISSTGISSNIFESNLYPQGFGGEASIVPSQQLVDAFPAANGYPITDLRSNYVSSKPYENRDPRFYAAIHFNGSQVLRNTNSELMYTFECATGGKDAPGLTKTSPTGYYVKKFVFTGWNPYDEVVVTSSHAIFYMRWEQMCLIFAEAASKVTSPDNATMFGISPKQALAYLRNRTTSDGKPGLGVSSDPYLDECAASPALFDALVKNEWRITTCFEGNRFFDLRRWTSNPDDLSAINTDVQGVSITGNAMTGYNYSKNTIERKSYPSLWLPIPYLEVRRCPNLVQNAGWENWK